MNLMRRVIVAALLLAGVVAVPGTAQAEPTSGTCSVSPNPVPVGTSYTVTATGLTVNTAFLTRIQQPGVNPVDVFTTSDAAGNASTGPLAGPQQPGTVTATWKKLTAFTSGGGPVVTYGPSEATCSWAVTA